jgi:hypothetical protein
VHLSTDKSDYFGRQRVDSIGPPAKPLIGGRLDHPQSPRYSRDFKYGKHDHLIGHIPVRLHFPDVHSKKLISIVSSRIGKNTDQKANWFDAIRTLAVQLQNENLCILTAPGTTTYPYLCRISELFGLTLLSLTSLSSNSPTSRSAGKQKNSSHNFPNAIILNAFYDWQDTTESAATHTPNIDQLIIDISQDCFVISCRKKGLVHDGLNHRLQKTNTKITRLLVDRKLTPPSVESELTSQGAVPWRLYKLRKSRQRITASKNRCSPSTHQAKTQNRTPGTAIEQLAGRRFLIHWTRQSTGPWPDQSYSQFLDDLIFNSPTRGEGALSPLKRILGQQKIHGTNTLTKSQERVICFTAVPPFQYADRRIFRPHLSRWDFEHYGIAFDCELLKKLGARPVNYGTKSDWTNLSSPDRPFFQMQNSKTSGIDWREEQEWRLRGDLDLKKIPPQLASVFVNTDSEREALKDHSRWPVVSVKDLENLNLLS